MKVTAIDSVVLRVPTRSRWRWSSRSTGWSSPHIRTDEGIRGLGYSLAFGGGGAEAIQVYLETRLEPLLIGEDPLLVERLWEKMFRADRGIKRQGVAAYALAALDIGLWDIAGKAAGQPLFKLWGAVTDRVAAYGSGGWAELRDRGPDRARRETLRGHGCRYYKMKIHDPDPRANRARVRGGEARRWATACG